MISDPTMPRRSVLIVDQSEDSREVLREILQNRGMQIFEAREALQGLRLAEEHQPAVIVLDLEAESCDTADMRRRYHDHPDHAKRPHLLILGKLGREDVPSDRAQVVSKPYHYGPLVRKIEQLLEHSCVGPQDG